MILATKNGGEHIVAPGKVKVKVQHLSPVGGFEK